jgi:DNA-binding NtrC family response regulator
MGHETVLADGGAAAKRLLAEDQGFDVIVFDMMMPHVSGMDLHEWLASSHPQLAARLIFVSGGVFTPRARRYLNTVDVPQLDKPVETANLRRLVADVIRRHRKSP